MRHGGFTHIRTVAKAGILVEKQMHAVLVVQQGTYTNKESFPCMIQAMLMMPFPWSLKIESQPWLGDKSFYLSI